MVPTSLNQGWTASSCLRVLSPRWWLTFLCVLIYCSKTHDKLRLHVHRRLQQQLDGTVQLATEQVTNAELHSLGEWRAPFELLRTQDLRGPWAWPLPSAGLGLAMGRGAEGSGSGSWTRRGGLRLLERARLAGFTGSPTVTSLSLSITFRSTFNKVRKERRSRVSSR